MSTLSHTALTEEINFFRDYCGWSDRRIETHLHLADGTLAQRRRREAKRRQATNADTAITLAAREQVTAGVDEARSAA